MNVKYKTLNNLVNPEDGTHSYLEKYTNECEVCGRSASVVTQGGMDVSEYITDVHVECAECGSSIQFILPVN